MTFYDWVGFIAVCVLLLTAAEVLLIVHFILFSALWDWLRGD